MPYFLQHNPAHINCDLLKAMAYLNPKMSSVYKNHCFKPCTGLFCKKKKTQSDIFPLAQELMRAEAQDMTLLSHCMNICTSSCKPVLAAFFKFYLWLFLDPTHCHPILSQIKLLNDLTGKEKSINARRCFIC